MIARPQAALLASPAAPTAGRALSHAGEAVALFATDGGGARLGGRAPAKALGLPGGLRIFGSAMQAVLNLVDHGMSLQEAVEAPRLWTMGGAVEMEAGFGPDLRAALAAMGHTPQAVPHVAGGMCAVRFHEDGLLEGAACWRADGAPVGLGGGPARPGVRFWPDATR